MNIKLSVGNDNPSIDLFAHLIAIAREDSNDSFKVKVAQARTQIVELFLVEKQQSVGTYPVLMTTFSLRIPAHKLHEIRKVIYDKEWAIRGSKLRITDVQVERHETKQKEFRGRVADAFRALRTHMSNDGVAKIQRDLVMLLLNDLLNHYEEYFLYQQATMELLSDLDKLTTPVANKRDGDHAAHFLADKVIAVVNAGRQVLVKQSPGLIVEPSEQTA